MIKTSIIVPVYNTEPYLKDCFDSIFNQTQKEIEVIAINDGSTDNSLSVLESIKEEHPELIIFSQENKGLGAARNKGMELATGEFVYFIDSDDCLERDAMETCYHYAKTNDVDMVLFDANIFGEIEGMTNAYDRKGIIEEQYVVMNGEEYAKKYWLRSFFPSAWMIYTSAKFLKKYIFRFPPRIYYEDNVFHCSTIPLAKVMYLPQMLYKRRLRENSITQSAFDLRHAKDYLKMIQLIGEQKHSKEIENIIGKLQRLWMNSLLMQSIENNLLDDLKFAEDFYQTVLKIYGNSVEQITRYQDINWLCKMSDALGSETVSDGMRKAIEDRRKELVQIFLENNPLAKADGCIGIYGTGIRTERFLREYKETIGKIKSNICFIESDVKSGERKYMGFDVFNINDIGNMQLDYIIITSAKYEQQMRESIRERYGDKFKVLFLKESFQLEE